MTDRLREHGEATPGYADVLAEDFALTSDEGLNARMAKRVALLRSSGELERLRTATQVEDVTAAFAGAPAQRLDTDGSPEATERTALAREHGYEVRSARSHWLTAAKDGNVYELAFKTTPREDRPGIGGSRIVQLEIRRDASAEEMQADDAYKMTRRFFYAGSWITMPNQPAMEDIVHRNTAKPGPELLGAIDRAVAIFG